MPTPSIVPAVPDETVHIVLEDLGELGHVYTERNEEGADLETTINDVISGEVQPVRIVAFNVEEGWSRDVTEDIAREILRRWHLGKVNLHSTARDFVMNQTGMHLPEEVT